MGDEIMPNWLGLLEEVFATFYHHFFQDIFLSSPFHIKNIFLTLPFRSNFLLLANFLKIPEKADIDCSRAVTRNSLKRYPSSQEGVQIFFLVQISILKGTPHWLFLYTTCYSLISIISDKSICRRKMMLLQK